MVFIQENRENAESKLIPTLSKINIEANRNIIKIILHNKINKYYVPVCLVVNFIGYATKFSNTLNKPFEAASLRDILNWLKTMNKYSNTPHKNRTGSYTHLNWIYPGICVRMRKYSIRKIMKSSVGLFRANGSNTKIQEYELVNFQLPAKKNTYNLKKISNAPIILIQVDNVQIEFSSYTLSNSTSIVFANMIGENFVGDPYNLLKSAIERAFEIKIIGRVRGEVPSCGGFPDLMGEKTIDNIKYEYGIEIKFNYDGFRGGQAAWMIQWLNKSPYNKYIILYLQK